MARRRLLLTEIFQSESSYATEFRRLLQKIEDAGGDAELKTILITSAMLSEGKSTIAGLLAIAAAKQKGMRTLLIDCDIRRPTVHRRFGLERLTGLVEVVTRGISFKDAVQQSGIENLDIITAGEASDHPSELFGTEVLGTIFEEMKFYYDLIIIDSAPALPVSDPMLLASKVDGILLVVKSGATQVEVVKRAVDILDPNKSRICGVVVNNYNRALPYYYDDSYYGYRYEQPKKDIVEKKKPRPAAKSKPKADKTGPTTGAASQDVARHE